MEITEQKIEELAPNAEAAKKGRELEKKKKFANLKISAEGDLIWGECAGSGKNPYYCSVDFKDAHNPISRCNCPSRQFPCKHGLGLLYCYAADASQFTVGEVPEDILSKREKIEKKQEKKAQEKESIKEKAEKPKKVNVAALTKKIDAQLSGIAIAQKLNICMVGGTGSGKTTFTKSLVDLIPSDTRLITIEDTHELDTPNHPNHAHLFYKEHITAKQIIASCMRLKPDRILLTELRGDEAWDYLSALNTGHPGGLTSVHANDARSVHYRIAQLAMESAAGKAMPYEYILNTVRATIDVVCFFKHTYMTELYFDPVEKYLALRGRV